MKCNCKYCKDIDYDNSEYFVDLSLLTNERPIGVSGLLRVKNDAEFLALCVDSCIDALDELIIVYQECDDDSPQIIEQKRQQYPDKIRTYFYRPLVLSHNLTSEELHYVSTLDKTSIHLLSNYYNYTLSKASYRYAIKIDGDQVYFTDKLKSFCNAEHFDYIIFVYIRHSKILVKRLFILIYYNIFYKNEIAIIIYY